MIETPYLTTAEVAAYLRKTPDYVARQCAAGALRGKKLGNTWRIHRESVEVFMGGPQVAPPTRARRRRAA